MITKFLPTLEKFQDLEQQYIDFFNRKGDKDILGKVISNMKGIAELQASQGVDAWLGYGVYLPAIERIFALHQGESETNFLARTEYPEDVIWAYTIHEHDIATLIAADKYSRIHQQNTLPNTHIWPLNDEGRYLDLNQFTHRLQSKI